MKTHAHTIKYTHKHTHMNINIQNIHRKHSAVYPLPPTHIYIHVGKQWPFKYIDVEYVVMTGQNSGFIKIKYFHWRGAHSPIYICIRIYIYM